MWGDWITLEKAGELLPDPKHASTLWRWHRNGYRCRNGLSVQLQARRIGKRMFTTQAWMEEFIRAVNENDLDRQQEEQLRIPDHATADAMLRAAGM